MNNPFTEYRARDILYVGGKKIGGSRMTRISTIRQLREEISRQSEAWMKDDQNCNFFRLNLSRYDLSGLEITKFPLSDSVLDFSHASIIEADLSKAILKGYYHDVSCVADKYRAGQAQIAPYDNDYYGFKNGWIIANFQYAKMMRANLMGADLTRANFCDADLTGANFKKANLTRSKLSRARLVDASLIAGNLSGANLFEADLTGADLKMANLCGADLTLANLTGANLKGADLRGANLAGADFSEASLMGANLERVDFRGAKLNGADFCCAFISKAIITRWQREVLWIRHDTDFVDGFIIKELDE